MGLNGISGNIKKLNGEHQEYSKSYKIRED